MVHTRQACSNPFTSNMRVFESKKWARLIDARLQAVLSRNIYSEHGFEALIRPPSGQVCHSLIVVSNCTPGSAQAHAAKAISSHNFCEGTDLIALPVILLISSQGFSSFKALKKLLEIRTELLEFCPETVR